jgi:hypothetical protein
MQKPLTNEFREKFLDLACGLSPENLSCDGTISRAAMQKKYNRLMKEWHALEKQFGRNVSESEVWEAHRANFH